MHQENLHNFEFGPFLLNPKDRVLSHLNQPVDLAGKDFDVLQFLVEHPNEFLTNRRIMDAVWTAEKIGESGTITHHIARVRKALGSSSDRYIRTIHGRHGYRFVAPVSRTEYMLPDKHAAGRRPYIEKFEIEAHVFVPVYLGKSAYTAPLRTEKTSAWIAYKELVIEKGRLCVLKNGAGVWHLKEDLSFHTLVEVAAWRKEFYDRLFKTDWLKDLTQGIVENLVSPKEEAMFRPILGKPGYAYSALILKGPRWKDPTKAQRVLQILACPKPLEVRNESTPERERIRTLEWQLLEDGLESLDMQRFGLAGEDVGFASWEGLSLFKSAPTPDISGLIEFQIAVHALWWFSKCLSNIWLSSPDFAAANLTDQLVDIKRQLFSLKKIGAQETISQRTMTEAVLRVNRVEEIVAETLALYA